MYFVVEIRWKVHGEFPFKRQHRNGNFVLEPCKAELEAHIRGMSQWSFAIWDWRGRRQLVVNPVAKRPKSEELMLAGAKPLNAEDDTLYRLVTMCVNYMSLDRSDLSFAAGSAVQGMKSPTTKDLEELKRVGCYLRGRPIGASVFELHTLPWEHASPALEWRSCGERTWSSTGGQCRASSH